MDKTNEKVANAYARDDIIALGAVSTETKGKGLETEVISDGDNPITGISEE